MTAKLQIRATIALVAVLFVWTVSTGAQDKPGDVCRGKDKNGNLVTHPCNGISVGAPKVFDNRTLTLMLEALSQTLSAQQQSYVDQKSVLAALSNIQGFSQTETSTNLSLTGTPTPATDVKTTLNTGNVDASGNPLPNTFQRQTDVSRASVTPQAPALDTLPAFQGFNPTYGSSASDLLNDQVNLTYQIFNLRMILERSLSDRLLPDVAGGNKTRLQAVLGFNVTIDPPRTANDAVAVVEITLTSNDNDKDKKDLSLVSLMPQEKTYNSAALSNKSNAFGGAAAVSAFQIGFSARKRSQIFYLYRDTDTLSYERMTGDPKTIVFGWMFRPVLGRRSVSPGLRQMFAIMALPNVDCTNVDSTCRVGLTSKVRTYWKKYDRATLTSFRHDDANRASLVWYGFSMGLAKPQIFDAHRYENEATYPNLVVQSSANYQDALGPSVTNVTWRPIGAKNVIVSVTGNNFFTNTQVAIGDKIYSALADGLILKSNQGFDLTAPLDALVSGPGTVIGRYGVGIPLIKSSDLPPGFGDNGVQITGASIHPSLGGHHRIEIQLQGIPIAGVIKAERGAQRRLSEARSKLEAVKKQLAIVEEATRSLQSAQGRLESQLAEKNLTAITAQLGDFPTLQGQATALSGEVKSASDSFDEAHLELVKSWRANGLQDLNRYTPVISVNGKPLELPYHQSAGKDGVGGIQADVPDADLADGGGLVKVSWPFYPADKWTTSAPFYDPDKAFEVTRVSPKSILIHRIDGLTFLKGPENTDKSTCWNLIAGDEELPLIPGCSPRPTPKPDPSKPDPSKPDPSKKDKAGTPATPLCAPFDYVVAATANLDASTLPYMYLCAPSDYVVAATVENLPDKVVLVAPSGSIYTLAIPALKAKDDKVGPIELKQYDSQWIEIKSADLTARSALATGAAQATGTKNGPDLSKVTSVEANGKPLNYVKQEDKTTSATDKTKKPTPSIKSIKVEITRDLTSKPGTVDIAFHGAGNELLGTRQLHITQTEWGNKGDK